VEAERWIKQNQNLQGDQLASAVDQQPWDPSIKALTAFPQVLDNMNTNLSWTSALGDAYMNDPSSVMKAIQVLRQDAQNAGNLKSSPQQTVSTEGQTIVIQPADPEVVYVPSYSPEEIYGETIAAYPGYSGWDAFAAGAISFGTGMAVGAAFGNYGWGWRGWGADWHGGNVTYNRNNFVSNSNTFANRRNVNNVNRNAANINRNTANVNRNTANVNRNAADVNRGTLNQPKGVTNADRGFNKPSTGQFDRSNAEFNSANRGFGSADRSSMGRTSGAFGGYSQGGSARMDAARGSSSFGGGGARGGGGGGSRGGGGGRR
jgi:hypothetical protein